MTNQIWTPVLLSLQESLLLLNLILPPSRHRLSFSNLGLTAVAWSPLDASIVFFFLFSGGSQKCLCFIIKSFPLGIRSPVSDASVRPIAGPCRPRVTCGGSPSDSLEMFHYCCVANVQIIVFALYCRPPGNKSRCVIASISIRIVSQIKPKVVMLILIPFHLLPSNTLLK